MKKTVLMSAAKKARIALAVMAVCGMSFVGAQEAFAADVTTDLPVKTDAGKNIICGDGAKAEKATGSTVDPANDIVIGVNAIANDKNSIAIGTGANAKAENSVAIGYGSVADAANTISFGSAFDDSKNKRLVNLAAGTSNNDAATYGQVITSVKQNGNKLEFYTGTNTTKAMDVELNHPINFKGSNLVSNGATIVTDSTVTGNSINNIVIGDYAKASKGYDSGYSRESNPQYNIIIGNSAQAKGVHNIVMGAEATTDGTYGVVLGYKAQSKGEGIAIGAGSKATYGVAIRGTAEGSGTIAISNFSVAKGYSNTAIGYSAKATGSESSLALGTLSEASEKLAIAIGYYSKASKEGSIAIGPWAEVSGGISAIGYNAKATGEGSIAYSGTASGESSLALGGTASGKSSYALGGLASGKQSVSIGAGSVAKYDNVVSVGMGEDTQWWNSLPAYRRIVNMADGIANHDAATFGQIIKKDTYTISLDDTGNGNVVLKTNADKEGPTIKVDASALDTQIKQNADAIGTLTNLTTTEKTNLVGAVNEVKGAADAAQTKANDAFTQANTNKASIGTLTNLTTTEKTNLVGAVNEVKGTADTALGLANTNKANIGSLSADGNYIKKGNNVSKNLSALDDKVKENTDAINTKADKDLSNITDAGKNVIKDLAGNKAGEIVDTKLGDITSENYVNKADTVNANISALDKQVKANESAITVVDNKIGSLNADGNYIKKGNNVSKNLSVLDDKVKANEGAITAVDNKIGSLNADGNYIKKDNDVSNNLSALDDKVKENADAINTKADKDLSNITDAGKDVIKNLANEKAGEIVDTKLGDITSENYVKKTDTVNANISALDKQVKANADAINTKADKDLSNISDAGKDVIKDLAGNKAGEIVDTKLGDITSENYVNKADTVNANISALDKQMKVNTDNIGDTGKLTAAGLGSNLSDAVVKVNDKVGTADELKALKDAGLGDNLAQATAAVNKKADNNAEAIKTVNGRVDELGGRVDTLGGAVSKLDTKVNKVGAGAAALAALHPMEFDSDNKLSFAAGVGNYRGTNAAAIGAFYRPSEQVMFSISSNMGNGENMVNAGVSFALDRPSKTPTTKAALVKTVAAQNEQIAALNETVAEQNEKIARLEAMVEKLVAKQNA